MNYKLTVTEAGLEQLREFQASQEVKIKLPAVGMQNREYLMKVIENAFVKRKRLANKGSHQGTILVASKGLEVEPSSASLKKLGTLKSTGHRVNVHATSSNNLEKSPRESVSAERNISPETSQHSVTRINKQSSLKFRLRRDSLARPNIDLQVTKEAEGSQVMQSLKELQQIAKSHPSKHIKKMAEKSTEKFRKLQRATRPNKSMHDLLQYVIEDDKQPGEPRSCLLNQKYSPLKASSNKDYLLQSLDIDHEKLAYIVQAKFTETDFMRVKIASLSRMAAMKNQKHLRIA